MKRATLMQTFGGALMGVLMCIPAAAAAPPIPGTLNYVEGQVAINGQTVTPKQVGSAQVEQGGVIGTGTGKAEILLNPGVVLRIGDNSQVRLDSTALLNPRVNVLRGDAMVEADQVFKQNNIQIAVADSVTTLDKEGLYEFNAAGPMVRVFKGKADVMDRGMNISVDKDHELMLASAKLKAHKFDSKAIEDDLYAWSALRSEYQAEANVETARTYVVNGGWGGPGWYWDPWFSMYAFVPGNGFFYGPFGYPFFSPWYAAYYGPVYYGGAIVAGHTGHYGVVGHPVVARGAFRGGVAARGGFATGGFRAGSFGGGFHGGGFGGRR
jgi:hypothetical protein